MSHQADHTLIHVTNSAEEAQTLDLMVEILPGYQSCMPSLADFGPGAADAVVAVVALPGRARYVLRRGS